MLAGGQGEEVERRFSGSHASTTLALVPRPDGAAPAVKRFVRQQVPDDILHNPQLNQAIKVSLQTSI